MMNTYNNNSAPIPLDCFVNKIEDGIPSLCIASEFTPDSIALHTIGGPIAKIAKEIAIELQLPNSKEVLVLAGKTIQKNNDLLQIKFTSLNSRHKAILQGFYASERALACVS